MSRSINEIEVDKEKLLAIIRQNRASHRATFEQAMEGYREKAIEILEAHIDRIKAGAPEKVAVTLPMPEDHTEEYNLVISMLDMSVDDTVLIDQDEYNRLVLDNWFWKPGWVAATTAYITS